MTEDAYRLAEYNVLIKSSGSDAQPFHSQNYPIAFYDPSISKYFKSISLVHKLQETRAFVGFSRAEPKELPISERKKCFGLVMTTGCPRFGYRVKVFSLSLTNLRWKIGQNSLLLWKG